MQLLLLTYLLTYWNFPQRMQSMGLCNCRPSICLFHHSPAAVLLLSAQQAENIDRDIAPSLSTFRQRLKTFLFQASFPDIITDPR